MTTETTTITEHTLFHWLKRTLRNYHQTIHRSPKNSAHFKQLGRYYLTFDKSLDIDRENP